MIHETILLVGAGGHARSCIDVIEQEGRYKVGGLIGLAHEVGTCVMGYNVLGTNCDLPNLLSSFPQVLIAVGQITSPEDRVRLYNLIVGGGCSFPVIVSPRAYVSPHAKIGAGTIVMHDAVVNAGASIGRNCIINSRALIEHDAVVGDHCHIATAAVINGNVLIGSGSFVGSNSCVRQGIRIEERCVVGMGQLVLSDCMAGSQIPALKDK